MAFSLIAIQIIIAMWQLQVHPILLELYDLSRVYPPVVVRYSSYIAFAFGIYAIQLPYIFSSQSLIISGLML
jgi:hypothetical protein